MYRKKGRKPYTPALRKWTITAFRGRKPKIKRFLVSYEAVVDGEHIVDALYVLAKNPDEALRKARNIVKSFHPKAKAVATALREEHTFWGRRLD